MNDIARANGRTFLLLGLLGVGSLLIWGLVTSFFTLAPFIKFLHSCSRMLAVPRFYLWIGVLGMAILVYFLGYIIYTAIKQKASLNKYLVTLVFLGENPDKLKTAIDRTGTKRRVLCVESTNTLAFTYGIVRPKIVVSTSLIKILDEDELVAVLLHEICHCQHRDPLKLYSIKFLFSKVLRYSPIANLINYFLLTMELRADEYATRLTDRSWALASALLKVIQADMYLPEYAVGIATVIDARVERCLNQAWMPEPALSRKDKIILAGYASLMGFLIYFTYSKLILSFGCHINLPV